MSPPEPAPPGAGRLRVLLAEDDAAMRRMLAAALRRDGYEVVEAADGHALLRLVGASLFDRIRFVPPDLLISDIRMPGATGLDVLALVRTAEWSIPIILITAFGDPGTHDEARRLGATALFDKPFDVDDLCAAVRGLVPSRP